MFEHYPSPVIFAHRGDLTYAPENTLPSFQQALQKGADGVELDAKLTADGQVIVIHDMTVDRTTTGKGRVASFKLELTNYSTPRDGLVLKVCELIKRHNIQKQILFSSFLPSNLKIAAQTLPEIPRGLLAMPGLVGLWARSFGFMFGEYQALHPHISSTSREQVQRVHRLNRRVHVWTANSPEEVNRLKEWGVDGIFTDDPQTAVRALGRSR